MPEFEIFESVLLSFVAALCIGEMLFLCVLETFLCCIFSLENLFVEILKDCDKGVLLWAEFVFSLPKTHEYYQFWFLY